MEKYSYEVMIAHKNLDTKLKVIDSEWQDNVKAYFFQKYDTSNFTKHTNDLVDEVNEYSKILKQALHELKSL